ncbi:MAG: CPBP family intramembrane glutamic endopeptidase, partial [Candidatus Thorarchaeota archaeon]
MDKIRVLLFALALLLIILLHEITSIVTASMDQATRGLIGTLEFFGSFVLMYLSVVAFMHWERSGDVTNLGLQTDDRTLRHLIVGLVAGTAAAAIVYLIAMVFGGDLRPLSEITEDLIATEIIITVPVALFEELAYRGYLMTRMERVAGRTVAIFGSAIWFALLHFSWWVPLGSVPLYLIPIFTFNLFLGGVVLGYSYYWSGERLWVPIAFHFAWNMLAYILFPVYPLEPVNMVEIF